MTMMRGQLLQGRLFAVLLRVCRITCTRPHTRPQLDERHDAFVAVERGSGGNGFCRIRRHGLEKILYSSNFPSESRVADVDVKGLRDWKFECPVWREGECLKGAGMGEAEAATGCR
jgi:hypothetical protein